MLLLQSLVPQACNQDIKSNTGAIKCHKEVKITAPPNERCNFPSTYQIATKLAIACSFEFYQNNLKC